MTSTSPITDLITHLESYNDSHISGSSSLKSAIWDLNKARRQRGSHIMNIAPTGFSALDIREELRAQTKLICDVNEPALEDDDDCVAPIVKSNTFTVRYHGTSTKEGEGIETQTKSNPKDGMRQRKKGSSTKEDENENKWVEETYLDKEEEKLLNNDPIHWFGGGNRNLKLAQKHAKESLLSYIAAANKVAEIMQVVNILAETTDKQIDKDEGEE